MNVTQTAYGTWSGGRFMHFGEVLEEKRYLDCIRLAYESGVRTFVTADVYGQGKADAALGEALADYPRDSYCLVGTIGHDFYKGTRQGSAGYPRFTDPDLRTPLDYRQFLREACEKSLTNCRTDHFDLLLLHNPDERGYTMTEVWDGLGALKAEGMAQRLGVAPGPANGFTLDLIYCLEHFGEVIDWAMIILNPLEPWPGQHVLPAAEKNGVKILTRVVDYGGMFHGVMTPGHHFRDGDHRAYRPDGWVEAGYEKIRKMKPMADKHGLTLLQFACVWNLSHGPVECVVPTFIQEAGDDARPIEDQIREYAALPDVRLSAAEVEEIRAIGDNTGCMPLKGASRRHEVSARPDEWPMRPDLLALAERYGLGENW
ncbi:MAG: aldo/keto reductase [Akkermansiaceae bacterium]|nr:aldo/keto reductase [Akkermansiaceae bacterium]NNM29522.1 aldo/keto reductase [Akkermansiaceae bacterium]